MAGVSARKQDGVPSEPAKTHPSTLVGARSLTFVFALLMICNPICKPEGQCTFHKENATNSLSKKIEIHLPSCICKQGFTIMSSLWRVFLVESSGNQDFRSWGCKRKVRNGIGHTCSSKLLWNGLFFIFLCFYFYHRWNLPQCTVTTPTTSNTRKLTRKCSQVYVAITKLVVCLWLR